MCCAGPGEPAVTQGRRGPLTQLVADTRHKAWCKQDRCIRTSESPTQCRIQRKGSALHANTCVLPILSGRSKHASGNVRVCVCVCVCVCVLQSNLASKSVESESGPQEVDGLLPIIQRTDFVLLRAQPALQVMPPSLPAHVQVSAHLRVAELRHAV